jgi:hypothetical protein
MKSRILWLTGWLALAAGLAVLGGLLLSARFMPYDDEGYVLVSVRDFCAGHSLYTEVFSQYGPAFYLFYKALHTLAGLDFDHDTGRLLTLGYWVASALTAGCIVQRLASSRIAGWSGAALTFVALGHNINEPFHPGSLLAWVGVTAAWLAVEAVSRKSLRLAWAVGALGAFAMLVKINVGLFILCPWGAWWLVNAVRNPSARRAAIWTVSLLVVLFPLVLMRAHLDQAWAMAFAWTFMASALAGWFLLVRQNPDRDAAASDSGWLVALAGTGAVVALGMVVSGTSLGALWQGAVIAPLRHPSVYTFPATTGLSGGILAWLSLLGLVLVLRLPGGPKRAWIVGTVRLIGLVVYFYEIKNLFIGGSVVAFALRSGPVFAAWMLIPMDTGISRSEKTARALLGWCFCWQILQAYPVAGSQVAWGCVLWPAIAMVGCVDLWKYAKQRWRYSEMIGTLVVAAAGGAALWLAGFYAQVWLRGSQLLGLPGAGSISLPPSTVREIRTIHANINRHAGIVFSLPGMFSFNLWSGRPTPTTSNVTHWFSLLDVTRQSKIMAALEQDPDSVIVVDRDHFQYLISRNLTPSGPLVEYLRINYIAVIRAGGYDLCVRRGRGIKASEMFRIDGDKLTAWVTQPSEPCPLFLMASDAPDAKSIPLESAQWTREGDLWRIEASLPAGSIPWPAGYLKGSSPQGELLWMRNPLPQR